MNNFIKRLKSKAGETLVESMAAILIFTFASIIMLSMVSSAADINTAAKEADREFYEQMVTVEKAEGAGTAVNINFSIKDSTSTLSGSASATMYGNADTLHAYYAGAAAPAGEGGGT